MIEPIKAKAKLAAVAEAAPPERPAPTAEPTAPPGKPAVQAAAALHRVPHARPAFEIHLDAGTLRVYSEMRDPNTDRVIFRLPTGYQPVSDPPADHTPTELDA